MTRLDTLEQLGIQLPQSSPPGAIYKPVRQLGNALYVSGQIPWQDGQVVYTGKLGQERSLEYGQQAARLCIINMLGALRNYLGSLEPIRQVVKLQVFVASEVGFDQQHLVANSASELLMAVFGEDGCAARTAIGTNQLPLNITVEIEGIFEVEI